MVARGGDRYVEGYVDLLLDSDEGLVVVDYKTDRAASEAERDAKVEHYRPQVSAYASAIGRVPGAVIESGALLFLSPEAATLTRLELS